MQNKGAIVIGTTSMEEKHGLATRHGTTFHVFVQDEGLVQGVPGIADRLESIWSLIISKDTKGILLGPRLASLLNSSSFETTSNTREARAHSSHLEPLRGVVQPFSPFD